MKKNWLTLLLSLSVILLTASISLADPSQLQIARTAAGALWTRTCNGTTCSAWGPISGVVALDPTLIWDPDTQRYYLYGIVSNGVIWRSTFDADGTFNNDWAIAGGSSSFPIVAAAGGRFQNFGSTNSSDMNAIALTNTAVTNIMSRSVYCPAGGFVFVIGTGSVEHDRTSAAGSVFSRIYLTQTSGGTYTAWNFTDVASGTGYTSFPFAVTRWFSVLEGSELFYMTGEEGGGGAGATITSVRNPVLTTIYFPYSY